MTGAEVVVVGFDVVVDVVVDVEVDIVVVEIVDVTGMIVVITVVFFLQTSQINRISLRAPRIMSFLSLVETSLLLTSAKSEILFKLFPNNFSKTVCSSDVEASPSFEILVTFCIPTVSGATTRTLGSCQSK